MEHALAGHPLTPAAVAGCPPGMDRVDTTLGEDPPECPLGDDERLPLGEQLGEVRVVHQSIGRRREFDDPCPERIGGSVGRRPGMIAVDETGRTVGAISFEQAADLAYREAQHAGRLGGCEPTGQDVIEDEEPVLRSGVQDDRLPRFHTIEGDKVTGRLARTKSLADDTRADRSG